MNSVLQLVIFFISFSNFEFGKEYNNTPKKNSKSINVSKVLVDLPMNYFPTQPGTEFAYKVKFGRTDPILQERIVWSEKNRRTINFLRYRIPILAQGYDQNGEYFLKLKIKDSAAKEIGGKSLIRVKLDVVQDDFIIYGGAIQIFWLVNINSSFNWQEKRIYSPKLFTAPNNCKKNGYSKESLFFDGNHGDKFSAYDKAKDKIIFKGVEKVPGLDVLGRHFVKTFSPRKNCNSTDDYANKAFEEHTYFVVGKGLVYLRQVVDGKTSMTWKLVETK